MVTVAALLAAGMPAAAQTMAGSAADTAANPAANPAPMQLPPISVTATRNPIEAFEYPGMVTVIGRDRMDLLQPSAPDDILKWVPNVEFTGGPRRTGEVPSIRGFSGPDVIVLIDDARQNFGSGHDGRFFVDPSLLREVEVLRGPASSLYGSGGTGGVIAMRTVRASDLLAPGATMGFSVSGGRQSVNREWAETATAFGRAGESVDVLASVTKRDSGSIELGDGSELDRTDDDILSGMFKIGADLAPYHSVEVSFQRFANDATEPNNGQGAGGRDIVDKEIRADNARLAYAYNDPSNRLIDLDATVYFTRFQADEMRLDNGGLGPRGELLKRDVDTLGLRLDNRSRFELGEKTVLTLTYGGEAYRDEQNGKSAAGPRDGVPNATASFAGFYGQGEIRVSRPFGVVPGDLLVVPGVRYDRYEASSSIAADKKDQAVSPRIGLTWLPTDWSMLFANYAHAFRAPSMDEMYLNGIHFPFPAGAGHVNRFVPNPGLEPQRTRTFELGGGLEFEDVLQQHDNFRVKASHFTVWGEDFIDQAVNQPRPPACNLFIPGNCDGTTRFFNVPEAKLWGKEVEASYETPRFRLAFGFSTIDGENEQDGTKLGVLTPPQVTLDTAVKVPEVDSVFGWRMLHAAKFDKVDRPADERDGYTTHDIYAAWMPSEGLLAGFRLDLGVDNVFDKSYERSFTGALEPGRNWKAKIGYTLSW